MKKIIAVDDDKATTDYYAALFSEAGYEVLTAGDTTAAMILFRETGADLLVLDVEMPSGGGVRAFEIVREIMERGVPVIFVTGMPEKVAELPKRYKQVRVLRKPAASEVLLAAVREACGQ